jgi:SAM-dependent methyltransferase
VARTLGFSFGMTSPQPTNLFTDDVAELYDKTLVPLIFAPYARDLATRVQALQPKAVLEVACGTGVVTRALALTLPATCAITATDLSDSMLAYGKSVGTARHVSWCQADVMALPHDSESFDVVVCQFGAMFFANRVAAYREIRRVLRPRGIFLFNVWNGIEQNDFTAVITEALGRRYPENPPSFMARIPHGYGSPSDIESDIRIAGFETCHLSLRDDISSAINPEQVALALCQGTPLRKELEFREPGGLERATAAAAEAIRQRYGNGPIHARISAIVVSAS